MTDDWQVVEDALWLGEMGGPEALARLREREARLEEALRFYEADDDDAWFADGGRVARRALTHSQTEET